MILLHYLAETRQSGLSLFVLEYERTEVRQRV